VNPASGAFADRWRRHGATEPVEVLRTNVRSNPANQAAHGVELIDIRLLEIEASR
jgi:hypothetical protein